jgi:aquaporin rerated protein, invertebrate
VRVFFFLFAARSFGSAAVAGIWQDQWLFWFGPFMGAIGAAFLYELVFKSRKNWENKYLPYNNA